MSADRQASLPLRTYQGGEGMTVIVVLSSFLTNDSEIRNLVGMDKYLE